MWVPAKYLNRYIRLKASADMQALELFPNLKEIQESFSIFNVIESYILKRDTNIDRNKENHVLCFVVGDGTTPRTAAVINFMTKWDTISCDPIMRNPAKYAGIKRCEVRTSTGEDLVHVVKQQVESIKNKLGRPGYRTKIRLLHLGTKEMFNKNAKKLVLSPFRIFSSANFNGFRPAFGPKKDYKISPSLEGPYINWWVKRRKKEIFEGYKNRSQYIGEKTYILNSEELATLFHFPITKTSISQPVESLESKKIQAPSNLPI